MTINNAHNLSKTINYFKVIIPANNGCKITLFFDAAFPLSDLFLISFCTKIDLLVQKEIRKRLNGGRVGSKGPISIGDAYKKIYKMKIIQKEAATF
jgi:hypothetical protein